MRMAVLIKLGSASSEPLITDLGVHAMGLLQAERKRRREKDDYKERIFTHLPIKLLPEARGADTHR